MFNENFLYALVIVVIGMFVGTTLIVGLIYISYKFFRNISPFREPARKIRKFFDVFNNIDAINKAAINLKYMESMSIEIYTRIKMINEESEKIEKKTFGEILRNNEDIIGKSHENETIMEYYESLGNESIDDFIEERSISKDDIPHELSIERSIVEEESFIVEDDENLSFIENTITHHEAIKPISTEDFKSLTPDEKKEYVSAMMAQNYETVENVPEKLRDVISSLDKFCNSNKVIESNDKIVIKKDFDTGRFKFGLESPVEKIYMDHKRNESNIYIV